MLECPYHITFSQSLESNHVKGLDGHLKHQTHRDMQFVIKHSINTNKQENICSNTITPISIP